MYNLMRRVGILLLMFGIGSFILPKFGRDSFIWQAFGSSRDPVMILSILIGAGLTVLSYRMQWAQERELVARRRAARDAAARQVAAVEQEDEPETEYSDSGIDEAETAAAIAVLEQSPVAAPRPAEFSSPRIEIAKSVPEPVRGASAVIKAAAEAPQLVAEYSPLAQEKAGSESVVIEKRDLDAAKRPTEKAASSILHPVSEKRVRPAFEEDPESIFDELPQSPPASLK